MTLTQAGQVIARAPGDWAVRARAWLRAAAARPARWSPTAMAKAAGAPIGPAERVLTTDRDLSGSLVVATRAAVYCQVLDGPGWVRRGWEDVTRVVWDERRCLLRLTGVGPDGLWRTGITLPSRTALVDLARERVTATLLASTTVRLGEQACAWVSARRQPGSGQVTWVVTLNGAVGSGHPALRAGVAAAVARLRAQAGIPFPDAAGADAPLPPEAAFRS